MSKTGWTTAAVVALVAAWPLAASAATPPQTAHITKAGAMKEIQLDGYTNVQDLQQQKKGWSAKAMEGGKQVSLLVTSQGVRKQ
jgi:ABC-type phosphate transport system substrate-binding protein